MPLNVNQFFFNNQTHFPQHTYKYFDHAFSLTHSFSTKAIDSQPSIEDEDLLDEVNTIPETPSTFGRGVM